MSEAEFCCDEGQWLADQDQYFREKNAEGDSPLRACHKRIENQREEIRRLHNHIRNLEQSRNAWKEKAERIGGQLKEITEENERLKAENETTDILLKDLRFRNKEFQKANEGLAKNCEDLERELQTMCGIKADTIQKMKDRLINYESYDNGGGNYVVSVNDIRTVAKDLLK